MLYMYKCGVKYSAHVQLNILESTFFVTPQAIFEAFRYGNILIE